MRFTTVLALVVAVTAAPLPEPQITGILERLPIVNDLPIVGTALSGVGNLADGILDLVGGLLGIGTGVLGDVADRLDPREWAVINKALAEVKTVIEPHVPTTAVVEKRDPQGALGNLIGGVAGTVGDLIGGLTSGAADALGNLLSIPRDILGGILDRLDPREWLRIKQALAEAESVVRQHMD